MRASVRRRRGWGRAGWSWSRSSSCRLRWCLRTRVSGSDLRMCLSGHASICAHVRMEAHASMHLRNSGVPVRVPVRALAGRAHARARARARAACGVRRAACPCPCVRARPCVCTCARASRAGWAAGRPRVSSILAFANIYTCICPHPRGMSKHIPVLRSWWPQSQPCLQKSTCVMGYIVMRYVVMA